jgi:LysM repeat protein
MPDPKMPDPENLSSEDWARIYDVYQTDEKLAYIANEYGVTVQKIVAHAQREGWPLRYEKGQAAQQVKKPGSTDPATLRKRLTALVERQIAEIETRLAGNPKGRDQERDARTLSNLTRTLDKLIELKREAARERAEAKRLKEAANQDGDGESADALRTDLARRLARLVSPDDAEAFSSEPVE